MKKGIKSITNPSAQAMFRIRRVVMERWRVRVRMLQMINRFPEMPIGKKRHRIRAPVILPAAVLMSMSVTLFFSELVVLKRRRIDML